MGILSAPFGAGSAFTATGATALREMGDRAAEVINVLDFNPSANDGSTDASAALAAAVTRANTLKTQGKFLPVYLPPGTYKIAATSIPAFAGPGSVIGAGRHRTFIKLDPSYAGGTLFKWVDAWFATNYSYAGPTLNIAAQGAGPMLEGFTVVGDLTAAQQQDAFVFRDRVDLLHVRDVGCFHVPGRVFYVGQTQNTTQAYMRESRFQNVYIWGCGTASVPAVEISSVGSGDASNTIEFHGLDVLGCVGQGIVIRNAASASHTRLIHFYGLRVEGNGGDGLVIGDPVMTGIVDEIHILGFRGNNSTATFATIRTTAPDVAHCPFNIFVQGTIDSGNGDGVCIDAGRNMQFRLTNIAVSGTAIKVASNATVGGSLLFDGNGNERSWTKSVDATSNNSLVYPVSPISQTNTQNSAQSFLGGSQGTTVSGFQAGAIAGFNQNITGTYSFGTGARTSDRGRTACNAHGGGQFSVQGDAQECVHVLRGSGNSTTAIRLTVDAGAAGAATVVNIPNGTEYSMSVLLQARNVTNSGSSYSWFLPNAMLTRDASAATTAVAAGTPVTLTRGTTSGASVSLTADTTNGGINLSFTPPTGNSATWHVVARVVTVEVA